MAALAESQRRRVLLATISFVILGVAVIALVAERRRKSSSLTDERGRLLLPFESNRLPEHASSIARSNLRDALGREPDRIVVPEPALWSYLAESMCGGHDVYRAAMDLALSWRHLPRFQRILATPRDELRETLACGKELSARIGSDPRQFSVAFDADEARNDRARSATLHLLPLSPATFPSSSHLKAWGPLDGLESAGCTAGWEAGGRVPCADFSMAAAKLSSFETLVHGTRAALETFARDARGAGYDFRARTVAELARDLRSYERVDIRFDARALFPPNDLPLPLAAIGRLKSVRAQLQVDLQWGVHAAAEAHAKTTDGEVIRVVLVAKGNDEALRLHAGMLALRDESRRALADKSEPRPRQSGPREWTDYLTARALAGEQAWKTADVVREGTKVIFNARVALDENEANVRRYRSWRSGQALAAARLVDDLIAGRPVRSSDLEPLGGAELVRRIVAGYKPFFAGDWACWQNHENNYVSFRGDQAYRGKERSERSGRFVYQIEDGTTIAALVSIESPNGGEVSRFRIETSSFSSSIFMRRDGEPWNSVVVCSSVGDEAEHYEPPPEDPPATIAPVVTAPFGGPREIKSEPDPEWPDSSIPTVTRDGFLLELAIGGRPDAPNVTAIAGDGRTVHVFRTAIPRSSGVASDWRRVELTLTDAEMTDLVRNLNEIRFLALPQRYVDDPIEDGALCTIRLHTAGRIKLVTMQNAFPEPLLRLARQITGYVDARPELFGLSQHVAGPYAFDGAHR